MMLETRIYTLARMMATDQELCQIFGKAPIELDAYREIIDRARAEGMIALRYERAKATARKQKQSSK